MCTSPPPLRSWNRVLPGPPNRNNAGAANCSPSGLLAYAAGSCVAVVDTPSMQLVSVLPIPPPSATSLAAYVTAVRWSPEMLHCLCREVLSGGPPANSQLLLAVGDRHGRIALWDIHLNSVLLWIGGVSDPPLPDEGRRNAGVQDLCWVRAGPNCSILGAIKGASLVSL